MVFSGPLGSFSSFILIFKRVLLQPVVGGGVASFAHFITSDERDLQTESAILFFFFWCSPFFQGLDLFRTYF